jgi:hypothetical protein
MKEKLKSWFKNIILILSVYFSWIVFLPTPNTIYSDSAPSFVSSIPLTILTIYIWNSLHKNK